MARTNVVPQSCCSLSVMYMFLFFPFYSFVLLVFSFSFCYYMFSFFRSVVSFLLVLSLRVVHLGVFLSCSSLMGSSKYGKFPIFMILYIAVVLGYTTAWQATLVCQTECVLLLINCDHTHQRVTDITSGALAGVDCVNDTNKTTITYTRKFKSITGQ